jgi:hypothetical protein
MCKLLLDHALYSSSKADFDHISPCKDLAFVNVANELSYFRPRHAVHAS